MIVTVVTPSFRQLELLKLCCASVSDQTGKFEVEHLIHDGLSGSEFNHWAAQYAPAGWISEKDGGMYDAINRGFLRGRGEIMAWLNCDEQYLPGTLDAVTRAFREDSELDIVFGDVVVVDGEGSPESYRMALIPKVGHIRYCTLATFSAATFVHRRIIDRGFLLDSRWKTIADAVWIERIINNDFKSAVIGQPLASFQRTGENLGQTRQAVDELTQWRRETGSTNSLLRRASAWAHHLRKWRRGAYRSRAVEASIYDTVPGQRRPRVAVVNERWRVEAPT